MELCISIKEKIATADHEAVVVCDNTDYTIRFQFDTPWTAHSLKTARFLWVQAGSETYVDVPFAGECVSMPAIHDAAWVQVGVYAGDLETTTPAMLMCVPSIRQGAPAPDEPNESVYDQIVTMINTGILQGPPGADGQTVRIWAVPERTSHDCIYDFIGFDRLVGGVTPTEETVNPGDVLICKDGGILYIRQIMHIDTRPVIISTTGTEKAEPPIVLAGKPGENGVTPVFSIGTVNTLAAGSKATASITGTVEKPVLNLGIPKGASGTGGGASSWNDLTDRPFGESKCEQVCVLATAEIRSIPGTDTGGYFVFPFHDQGAQTLPRTAPLNITWNGSTFTCAPTEIHLQSLGKDATVWGNLHLGSVFGVTATNTGEPFLMIWEHERATPYFLTGDSYASSYSIMVCCEAIVTSGLSSAELDIPVLDLYQLGFQHAEMNKSNFIYGDGNTLSAVFEQYKEQRFAEVVLAYKRADGSTKTVSATAACNYDSSTDQINMVFHFVDFNLGILMATVKLGELVAELWIASPAADLFAPIAHNHSEHALAIHNHSEYALAGYGYGGTPVMLSSALLRSDDELNTAIEAIYSTMSNRETKLICFIGYPDNSDYSWFGILSRSTANYGSMFAHSSYNYGKMISKAKMNGEWRPLEWEQPPMVAGTEYRTTERYMSKPVYVKLVDFGNLPNSTYKQVAFGDSSCHAISCVGVSSGGDVLPWNNNDSTGVNVDCAHNTIIVWCKVDRSSTTAQFTVKYTKD